MSNQTNKKVRRPINGVLLLNKPLGISSNRALQMVKRLFNAAKVGHTGTLDPLATGMLPLVFGETAKFSQYSLAADKAYLTTLRLGTTTTTGDCDGDIIRHEENFRVTKAQLMMTVSNYIGNIEQVPPMYSALKHQGQPLYKLARAGKTVERKPRAVTIHHIEVLAFEDKQVQLMVHCSKGTYIRTLVEDIGNDLGCGACVTALHRLFVEPFNNHVTYTLEQLQAMDVADLDSALLPTESMLGKLPDLSLSEVEVKQLYCDREVVFPQAQEGHMCLFGPTQNFVGVGQFDAVGRVVKRRLMSVVK